MNLVSQILAGVTGAAMVVIGLLEITRHGDRRLYPLFLIEPGNVPAVRMWAMNRRLQHRRIRPQHVLVPRYRAAAVSRPRSPLPRVREGDRGVVRPIVDVMST